MFLPLLMGLLLVGISVTLTIRMNALMDLALLEGWEIDTRLTGNVIDSNALHECSIDGLPFTSH